MWPGYAEEHYSVGPNQFKIYVGEQKVKRVYKMVEDGAVEFEQKDGWIVFQIENLSVHEMVVIE